MWSRGFGMVLARGAWGVVVLAALWLMLTGLWANIYFEPTGEAIAEARSGQTRMAIASMVLCLAAIGRFFRGSGPAAPLAVAAPALVCGLMLVIGEVAVVGLLVAFPIAFCGVGAGLLAPWTAAGLVPGSVRLSPSDPERGGK